MTISLFRVTMAEFIKWYKLCMKQYESNQSWIDRFVEDLPTFANTSPYFPSFEHFKAATNLD